LPKTFTIQAGASAIEHIKKHGLSPKDISVIPAAAGGPKWITLYSFDKYLLQNWFHDRKAPLHLVGASAGAWRMLCYALADSSEALDRYLKSYVEQQYDEWPTPEEVSQKLEEIITQILGQNKVEQLSQNAIYQLYVISTMTHFKQKKNSSYRAQFAKIFIKNALSRKSLSSDLTRIVFTNSDNHNLFVKDNFTSTYHSFSQKNLIKELQSTGTIPMLMRPVDHENIPNLLWDGALVDYHIGLNYKTKGLIFYPHFSDKIIEGWFDKHLSWRTFKGDVLDKMIMLSPSKEFVKSLPDSKIPDRKDFKTYFDNKDQRIKNWYEVVKRGEELAEEFDEYWKSGKLLDVIEPF